MQSNIIVYSFLLVCPELKSNISFRLKKQHQFLFWAIFLNMTNTLFYDSTFLLNSMC